MTSRGTNGFGERRSPPWRCHVDSALGFVDDFHESNQQWVSLQWGFLLHGCLSEAFELVL